MILFAKMFFLYLLIHYGLVLIMRAWAKQDIAPINFAIPSGSAVVLLWLFGVLG